MWATISENDATSQPCIVPCASYVWLSLKSVEAIEAETGHMQLILHTYIHREENEWGQTKQGRVIGKLYPKYTRQVGKDWIGHDLLMMHSYVDRIYQYKYSTFQSIFKQCAINWTHLEASPSSWLVDAMSNLSSFCSHWGPRWGGEWTAWHLASVLDWHPAPLYCNSPYLPMSVSPLSCSAPGM